MNFTVDFFLASHESKQQKYGTEMRIIKPIFLFTFYFRFTASGASSPLNPCILLVAAAQQLSTVHRFISNSLGAF